MNVASVAMVADSHISGPGGAVEPLLEQLAGLEAGSCDRLLLLGDLFQVWVGDRRFETPAVRAFVEQIEALRSGGVRVDYVEGNRDFFLATSPYAASFDSVVEEIAFEVDGKRFLAVHGDGLNDKDWKYRFWRSISKSWFARAGLRLMPGFLAQRIVHSTERQLGKSNFKHKSQVPKDVICRYAERRLAEGYDMLLLGHFHEEHRWSVQGGEVWLLDAWFRSKRVEWLGGGA